MTEPSEQVPPTSAPPTLLKCTVLITGTVIGKLQVAKGHKCQIEAGKAKALASLNPPAVRIDGV